MNKLDLEILKEIADLHSIPVGAYNIRKNGESIGRNSTSEIEIVPKKNKSGIDIYIKPNTQNKSVHIPVILTENNFTDLVYNDFYVGKNASVTIVAGCGIHNGKKGKSEHNGIHSFHLEKNAKVTYIEKHIALGKGTGEKNLHPVTKIHMKENSEFLMETYQLSGVSNSNRKTSATVLNNAKLIVKEKIKTDKNQIANTDFMVNLKGKNSKCEVISRSVASENSSQMFISKLIGKNECFGRAECDGIIMDNAKIGAKPCVNAEHINASLTHEATIGKIAGEQLTKLMTLGLSKEEAEKMIIKGFLK